MTDVGLIGANSYLGILKSSTETPSRSWFMSTYVHIPRTLPRLLDCHMSCLVSGS